MDESQEKELRLELINDFELYSRNCLKIRSKSGSIINFSLNPSQHFIHTQIEAQRKKTGRVRAIILKGRQQGCSTYVEGRYYWRVTHEKGVRGFILTHDQEATNNLFEMAARFHANCPPALKPIAGSHNAKELNFSELDSGYKVGTAGNKAVGRSSTIQFFHGSEVAFWPNAAEHAKGILQAVPFAKGTEVILESTANGIGNYFHKQWQLAESGQSEYIAIFVPWYWQDEYESPIVDIFRITDDEMELRDTYGLTNEKILWRRKKIQEFEASGIAGDVAFRQEYPCCPSEAFQSSGDNSFIPLTIVTKARKGKADKYGPILVGVDPARFGEDRTAIIRRQGRVAYGLETYSKLDTMQVTGLIVNIIKNEKPDKIYIDSVGLGAGIIDRLKEMGYRDVIKAVNGAEKPLEFKVYHNKRAEMWGEMKKWLQEEPLTIPDENSLASDLSAPSYKFTSNGLLLLEGKDSMKSRGFKSPDEGDALALTFAYPHAKQNIDVGVFFNQTIRI